MSVNNTSSYSASPATLTGSFHPPVQLFSSSVRHNSHCQLFDAWQLICPAVSVFVPSLTLAPSLLTTIMYENNV